MKSRLLAIPCSRMACLILAYCFCLNAQVSLLDKKQSGNKTATDIDLSQPLRSSDQTIPPEALIEQTFESAIDPANYILGPGDRILIKMWGTIDNQFITAVSPEGYVIIPSVDEIMVAGIFLDKAAVLIKNALSKVYRDSESSIRLAYLRKFRIVVAGEVENPGTYYLRAVDRVSDAVELAGGLAGWGDDTRIQLKRVNVSSVDTINISDFYLKGEKAQNSYLNSGDIIYVPSIDLTRNYVVIEGNVGSQGIYQIRRNETLFNFLTRLRTVNRKSNIENVVLVRKMERLYFNLLDPTSGARTELLQGGDRVIVPTTQDRVYVQGEVAQPGALPYLANYTAADYAGLAGLLESARDLNSLYVIRTRSGTIEPGRNVTVLNGDIVVVPRKKRETFKDYLTILTPIISIGISAFALIRTSK